MRKSYSNLDLSDLPSLCWLMPAAERVLILFLLSLTLNSSHCLYWFCRLCSSSLFDRIISLCAEFFSVLLRSLLYWLHQFFLIELETLALDGQRENFSMEIQALVDFG